MTEQFTNPCTYCGGRFVVYPGANRESGRREHERACPLGIDCPHCRANAGERCAVVKSGKRSPTHQSRRFAAQNW